MSLSNLFFFNYTATTEIYTYLHTLSLHDALPIYHQCPSGDWSHRKAGRSALLDYRPAQCDGWAGSRRSCFDACRAQGLRAGECRNGRPLLGRAVHGHEARAEGRGPLPRSEEHTSELQSLMRISYAVFCLKQKKK